MLSVISSGLEPCLLKSKRKDSAGVRSGKRCVLLRDAHFMTSCAGPRTSLLGNPLQSRSEQQVSLIPPVVSVRIFIEIILQILLANLMVDPPDAPFYQTPEALNRVRVN